MYFYRECVFLLVYIISSISAIPIPNGIVGEPEVECGEDTIEVVFLTEDLFNGRVFVVGHANETDCFSRDVGRKTTTISVPKDRCGVTSIRSINPPGLFVTVKVMISFHEEFITKIDRGYEISCFYMEAEKTVTYPLTVSQASLSPFTVLAEMPRCRYEVVDPVTMDPVSVVSVGSKLLHKWTCDSSAPNLWCMTVHSCFVEDGSGTEFTILKDDGCAIDRYLLDNLEYGPGLLQAQKEAHAFKFADKVVINFQCSIRLDIKDEECPIPQCPDLSKQRKRVIRKTEEKIIPIPQGVADMDVRAPTIEVLDPQLGLTGNEDPLRRLNIQRVYDARCIPIETLFIPASFCISLIIAMTSMIIYLSFKNRFSKQVV